MSLKEQEQRCAAAVLDYLTGRSAPPWEVKARDDDSEHEAPSFDLRLSDRREDLLVEITGLTDGPILSRYDTRQESLYEALAPAPGRSYCLLLPPPYEIQLNRREVRQLRRGIKRAAVGLGVCDKVPVAIPRRGVLKFMREAERSYISCNHDDHWLLSELGSEATGVYFLYDDWRYEHQFLTADCRSGFLRSLAKACPQSREQGRIEVEWREEWELQRLKDPVAGEGGVLVPGFVADSIESAAIRSIQQGIEHGKKKFRSDREGAKTAVALHAGEHQHRLSLKQYEGAIARLSAADVWPLDMVFLVDGDRVHRCFSYKHPDAPARHLWGASTER